MTNEEMVALAARIADESAPCAMTKGATLVVLVAGDEGWAYSLRGHRAHAIVGMEAALQDARDGKGFRRDPTAVA